MKRKSYHLLICALLGLSLLCSLIQPLRARAEGRSSIVQGCSLTLDGTIGLNFYVEIPDSYFAERGTYAFSYKGELQSEKNISSVAHSDSLYKFTFPVSAKDLEEDVTLHFYLDSFERELVYNDIYYEEGYSSSIVDYIGKALNSDSTSGSLKDLMKSLRVYGENAETYFEINTDVADLSGWLDSIDVPPMSNYSFRQSGKVNDVAYYGSSLLLKSGTVLRHYFTIDGDPRDLTFTMDGRSVTPIAKNGLYYVEEPGIPATRLDEDIVLTISSSDQVYSLEYSALAYASSVCRSSSYSDDFKAVMNSLYYYWYTAEQYFTAACQHEDTTVVNTGATHQVVCTACGTILEEGAHVASSDWLSNNTSHYHVCDICGLECESEAHAADDDETEIYINGKLYNICGVCGNRFTRTGADAPNPDVQSQTFTCLGADVFTTYFSAAESMEEFYAWQAFRSLMENKGIDLDVEWVNYDYYNTELQARFASMSDIPYYVSGYDFPESAVLDLADRGVIVDINEAFPYSDGTALSFFEDNDFGCAARSKVSTSEGHMYWLPNLYMSVFDGQFGVGTNAGVNIRYDWLQELDISMPTTTEEFKLALDAFNVAYGDSVGGDAVYSYDASHLNDGIAQWFGLVRGLLNVDWNAGEAQSPWLQDGFTQYISYVHDLYINGLYDPEMITSNDTLREKVSRNLVGAYTAYALSTTYEPLIEAAKVDGMVGACYVGVYPIDAIEGTHALLGLEDPVYMWDEFFFTNQCDNPALIAAFLDAYYSDAHLDLINYGVEGKNHVIVDGEKQWIVYTSPYGGMYDADQLNSNLQDKADERISYGKILYIRGGFPDYTFYRLDEASRNCTNILGWAAPKDQYQQSTLNYGYWTSLDVGGSLATATSAERELYNDLYYDISVASEQAMATLIVDGNIADIPGYIATLNDLGLSDLVQVYQNRYDRFVN